MPMKPEMHPLPWAFDENSSIARDRNGEVVFCGHDVGDSDFVLQACNACLTPRMVYVVLMHEPYEGERLDSVWSSLPDAIARAKEIGDHHESGWVMDTSLDDMPGKDARYRVQDPIFTTTHGFREGTVM